MNQPSNYKFFFLLCLYMLLAGLARAGVSTAMPDYVTDSGQIYKDWSYDFLDNGDLQLAGRVYLPTSYSQADTSKKYPLVVFYHGNYLGGGDNATQISSAGEITALRAAAETYKFILYLPQTIPKNDGWYRPGGTHIDMSILQIANLQGTFNIDREQLYITGFSMGGNATWSIGGIHAGAITALIPVDPNPGGLADSNAMQLLTRGVWSFCNRDDPSSGILSSVRLRMNRLRALAGKTAWTYPSSGDTYREDGLMRYTEPAVGTPAGHHANWAYLKPELYAWMFAQKNTTGWLQTGEKICFDFGNQQVATTTGTDAGLSTPADIQTYTRPDSAGVAWNSSAASYGNNFGAAFAFAKTTTGRSTLACLHVTGKFTDYNRTAAVQTLYDANIGQDGWITPVNGTGTVQLQGLTPRGAYKIEIFATTELTSSAYKTSLYQIGGQSQTLTVYNNSSAKASFPMVVADGDGKITVSVSGTDGSTYGMMATMEVTALPPIFPPLITSGLTASGVNGTAFSYQIETVLNNPLNLPNTGVPNTYGAIGLPYDLNLNPSTGLISGTLFQGGTFSILLSASNVKGGDTAMLTLSIQNPLDIWKSEHFSADELSNAQISGDTACPAGDGISNLMKYAFNLPPKENGAGHSPVAAPLATGSGNCLALTYTRKTSAVDINYVVEVSGDLKTWRSGTANTATVSATDNGDGATQSVTVRDLTPMSDASRRFIRLKLTKP